ncbi:hypothetical protein [Azospirillum brasilense]|uniref:hypothetical protein n=1 Tax=Azospirillum brasilense TaxID=192 RepID=UPI0013B36367|nr:hypothetical protein [Azospirillum brasilense]
MSRIVIYLDNNAWNFLEKNKISLDKEFPAENFSIFITKEIEFEIKPIPDEKSSLKEYIQLTIKKCSIKVDSLFGFYDDKHTPEMQRLGGFGVGRWASKEELDFIQKHAHLIKNEKIKKSGMFKNETDVSLAARSFNAIVLTLDKTPNDPLDIAKKQGGNVVFLTDFPDSGLSLREFVLKEANT